MNAPPAEPRRTRARALVQETLRELDAYTLTRAALETWRTDARTGDVSVLAFGKAAARMARAALDALNVREGIVIALAPEDLRPLQVFVGEHPTPAANATEAGAAVLRFAQSRRVGELVVCLVSGGGSSMLELPADGFTLDDIISATRARMAAGAAIGELNALRTSMSALKGGKLAAAMRDARLRSFVLSDVVDGPLSVVASGPTIPAAETAMDAETLLVGDNATGRTTLARVAERHGHRVSVVQAAVVGEARDAAVQLFREASMRFTADPACDLVVFGGETTVTRARDAHVRGGRCHELAVAALPHVGPHLLVAFGTDGLDGSSGAAGALADADILTTSRALGLDAEHALEAHDTAPFCAAVGGQLVTGPTGTNVADLMFVVRGA